MGRHSRDRSPKRRESDRRSSRDDKRERHSNQKDIEALKKRMKSSLNTAISDIRKLDQSDRDLPEKSHYDEDESSSTTIASTLERNTRIEKIEESGFTPATFISGRGTKKNRVEQKKDDSSKDHESAVFGPMWKSKELSKRMDKQANAKAAANQQQIASIPMPSAPSQLDTNFDDFPLAKQWLSSDPAIRQQRWIQTFHGQRRQLFDGVL